MLRVDEILESIGTMIAANTSFVKGESPETTTLCQYKYLQGHPDRCTKISNIGGGGRYQTARNRIDYALQAMSRAIDPGFAAKDISEVDQFMFGDGTSYRELPPGSPTFRIESIQAITAPQYMDLDEKGRSVYVVNYVLKIWIL